MEYDELKLFEELQIPYFSMGSYILPWQPADPIRPALNYRPPAHLYDKPTPDRLELTAEFVEPFDTIIVMHVPEWIEENWDVIKHKRVIWRSIGQSTAKIEQRLAKYRAQGMQVIRYSPREAFIPHNMGTDHLIRFYKDPTEYNHWDGGGTEVITFAQNMIHRGEYLNAQTCQILMQGFNAHIYGPKNEQAGPLNGGFLSYDQLKQKMRDARVYVYTGTQPASYTLGFIEAMMTGTPMVALGPRFGNSLNLSGKVYEIHEIIQNEISGFVSDDIDYLRDKITQLVTDKALAKRISTAGRARAIELFDKNIIKQQWSKALC